MGALVDTNIKITGLAKFAEVICYATGLTARGTKKMADANSYKEIKQAETDNEVALIKLKGQEEIAQYVLSKETRKANNVGNVINKAKEDFTDDEKVSDEPVNKDWINRFFSIVEDVSDEEMQNLWAKILSGEIKRPKSYSLRTLEFLKTLSKEEAECFLHNTQFIISGCICSEDKFGMSLLNDVLLLSDIGLISSEDLVLNKNIEPNSRGSIIINDNIVLILHNDTEQTISFIIREMKISKIGMELLSISEVEDNTHFLTELSSFLKSKGISRVTKHKIQEKLENNQVRYYPTGVEI